MSQPLIRSLGVGYLHVKARRKSYMNIGNKEIKRVEVPDEKVPWKVAYDNYSPTDFTDNSMKGKPWADPDIKDVYMNFNGIDGKINRVSFLGDYGFRMAYDIKIPLNPLGRTGLQGRGKLGRWGPNHAADPIVTRWKRDSSGTIEMKNGKQVLQFVSICRRDNKEWAIPGGMVDAGESVNVTLRREFNEEAMASVLPNQKSDLAEMLQKFFAQGVLVYRGYVDDPRNTDNAWMETVAVNFHDDLGDSAAKFPLHAGDDAGAVCWKDIGSDLQLYASHELFVKTVAEYLNAYW